MTEIVVPVVRPRRREFGALAQKLQHVIPAPVLLGDGITRVAEIAIGPATARILTRDGRERQFDLRDTRASASVRDALIAAEARRQQLQRAVEAV